MKRRRSGIEALYDHRAGVFSVLIFVMALAAAFIGATIVIRTARPSDGILVDIRTPEELREEARRLAEEVRQRQSAADAGYIRNAVSNAGAELRDDRATNTSNISRELDEASSRMNANREAWERGMQEIDAMKGSGADGAGLKGGDARAKGRVLVEFSLVEPLRLRDGLIVPGYRCEREGVVVVNIEVNCGGDVIKATVASEGSALDECMRETALDAARRSHFNIDPTAPERHRGAIIYTFVAQ